MQTIKEFMTATGTLLQKHLDEQESSRGAVSMLAEGASFEMWLSFETRMLMETHRPELGLDEQIEIDGRRVHKYWIGNEYKKVNLAVTDAETGGWVAALELKLIYNNKNWKKQCDSIVADLVPAEGTEKHQLKPSLGRVALVGVVGKRYRHADSGYLQPQIHLDSWEGELFDYLLPKTGGTLWRSRRYPIAEGDWLASREQVPHFFQLHAIGPATMKA